MSTTAEQLDAGYEVRRVAKAIYAGLFAGLVTLAALFVDDMTFDDISAASWIAVAIAFLGGFGGTYAIPNAQPPVVSQSSTQRVPVKSS